MTTTQKMSICLWFDDQAEDAAEFYASIFKNSAIGKTSYYGKEGFDIHGKPAGSVLTVQFKLGDMEFLALNGGPIFKFNESVSIVVTCDTQEEIDHYWNKLTKGGQESQCGWLKDKYGLSWQIVPSILPKLMSDPGRADRVMKAFMAMKKFDIEKLQQA
jgi:predicted 3-demethylubiquinone-9 3-methyltransferase (glyoxalase superfamily)